MEKNLKDLNLLKYAFIGDSLFDLITRTSLVKNFGDTIKIGELHKKNTDLVCAKSQARIIEYLINENKFTDEELEIFKRARNTKTNTKSRNSSIVDYHKATGLEAVLGYDYLNNKERFVLLAELVDAYVSGTYGRP